MKIIRWGGRTCCHRLRASVTWVKIISLTEISIKMVTILSCDRFVDWGLIWLLPLEGRMTRPACHLCSPVLNQFFFARISFAHNPNQVG